MTIEELAALLPGQFELKQDGTGEDDINYHLWFVTEKVGNLDFDDNGNITAVNIDKAYQSEFEGNAEVQQVVKGNNLTVNYI